MNKNLILLTSVLIATLVFTTGCNDEEDYEQPVLQSITLSPNPCQVGDVVTATVTYTKQGKNWYYYKQRFTFAGETVYNQTKSTGVTLPNPPTCEFTPTQAGTFFVRFSSTVSITAGQKLYEDLPTVSATLTVQEP